MYPKLLVASKTFWVNVLTFLVAVLGLLQGQEWIADHPQAVSIVGMAIGGINIALRWLTDRPVVMFRGLARRKPPRPGWQ
jgi:hypothetical protein